MSVILLRSPLNIYYFILKQLLCNNTETVDHSVFYAPQPVAECRIRN